MGFLLKLATKTATNAAALWALGRFIPGFVIIPYSFVDLQFLGLTPLIQSLIAGGFTLAVLNLVLRPILRTISAPFIFLTFGLFHIAINAAILYLADWYLPQLSFENWKAFLLGSILIGAVNSAF